MRPESASLEEAHSDDPVLTAERNHLAEAKVALQHMRARAEQISDTGADEYTSFALGVARAKRLAALADDPDVPEFFGRLDHPDETFHIGRRHVRDEVNEPLVIDWRAPMARAFYRATPQNPYGVQRRRRFGFSAGRLTSYEDERLDDDSPSESRILREEIERPRVGPMRDIVATIQPDQDEIVRSDLDVNLCVQGAPGTGKTAVGLHRAAYLLYTYATALRRSGALVVGPNRAFLGYIGAVLPALGEVGVTQVTIDELVERVPIRAVDSPEAALLKGDPRWAEVLRKAVYAGVRRPEDSIMVPLAARRYRIQPERLRRWVDDLRRGDLRYAVARERLRALIAGDIRRQREEDGGAPSDRDTARVARSVPVREALDHIWPKVDALEVVAGVLTDPPDVFDPGERDLVRWEKAPTSAKRARWSTADAVLIDEAADLLDRAPMYGHIVIDEAQDLSPMQCRAVGRRAAMGSVTVLGDIAQGTTPWATATWAETLRHLGKPDALVEHLTRGYRVPAAVLEIANRLLPHIAAGVDPATAVRQDSDPVIFVRTDSLVAAVVEAAGKALQEVGSIGIVVPDELQSQVDEAMRELPHDVFRADEEEESGSRIAVVSASIVKGLEFDHVVLVEPALIATGSRGLQRLYVALTRAVSRLVVVHSEALPTELAA
ncbi:MAG TPA: ATP-binding domain-containing protein [Mycobacteriales bacterium]|nr:ATP-binding domain-containing protein [Mycobacteriales bacterium]